MESSPGLSNITRNISSLHVAHPNTVACWSLFAYGVCVNYRTSAFSICSLNFSLEMDYQITNPIVASTLQLGY